MLRNRGDADVAMREVLAAMQGRMLAVAAAANDQAENEEAVGVRSPESVLLMGSPENWDAFSGKKRQI